MTFILLLPTYLSFLLLAAHFWRAGLPSLAVVSLAACLLTLAPRRWAALALQALLVLAAAEWVRTTIALSGARQAMGAPFVRMATILGTVALTALISATLYRSRRLRRRFGGDAQRRVRRG